MASTQENSIAYIPELRDPSFWESLDQELKKTVKRSQLTRVLIAEDEESLATLYRVLLKRFGYDVLDVVKSGDEVVEKYKELKPDVVIMDHRLERRSGLDALKEILKFDPNAKVIFASADDSIMEDAIAAGAIDYIGKPFSMQELVEVISRTS
jgi:two-component system chemotaxis response regulator CheY